MKKGNNLSVIRMIVLGPLFIIAGCVDATPYAFSVDQIKLLGNNPGFAEDEFDDGVIAPWEIDHPTTIESGGVVTLSNPGDIKSSLVDNYLILEEESDIHLKNTLGVQNEAGDFVTISNWLPTVPAQNQLYGMRTHLDKSSGMDLESINIGIFNIEPLLAHIFDVPAGLTIFFEQVVVDTDMEYRQLFPIDAEDITDSVLFSLYFDDNTDLFTGSFSLDGGVTFHSPFTPIYSHMSEAVFDGWELNAVSYDVQTVPEPSTLLLTITGLVGLGFAGRKKIKAKAF